MQKLSSNSIFSLVVRFLATLISLTFIAQAQAPPPARFVTPAVYAAGGWNATSVAIADMNGDGRPDLVVGNHCQSGDCSHGAVGLLLGNGDGTFQAAASYPVEFNPSSLAVSDLNGDGHPDVVMVYSTNPTGGDFASVLLSNGDGTFQAPVTYSAGGFEIGWNLAIGDLNGDGHPDLIVVNQCGDVPSCSPGIGTLGVLLGNGDGSFRAVLPYSTGGWDTISVAVADVNGDGHPDLVAISQCGGICGGNGTSVASVLLGNGDGSFQAPVVYDVGGSSPTSIAIGDVNGDGKMDLVVAVAALSKGSSKAGVKVLLGTGDGTFQSAVSYSAGYSPTSVAISDLNGDRYPDLVLVNPWAAPNALYGSASVLLGTGDGSFQPSLVRHSGGLFAESVAIADLNHDGRPDLAVVNECDNSSSCANSTVGVLLNITDFASSTTLTSSGSPSFIHQPVTFTAIITSKVPIPDGQIVSFYDGTALLGSMRTSGGVATFTTSLLSAKAHQIKAAYSGDSFRKASSGTVKQVVQLYPTATVLRSSLNPSKYGQAVTFTAQVTGTGSYALTGQVKFWDGSNGIGLVTATGGVATITRSNLAAGTHSITAEYLGDMNNGKNTSPVLNQLVQ